MTSVRGFSLVEVLAALAILATTAASLASVLHHAFYTRRVSRDLVRATELAADAIEVWRSGAVPDALATGDRRFERRWYVRPSRDAGLQEIEVSVAWNDGRRHVVELRTTARR